MVNTNGPVNYFLTINMLFLLCSLFDIYDPVFKITGFFIIIVKK